MCSCRICYDYFLWGFHMSEKIQIAQARTLIFQALELLGKLSEHPNTTTEDLVDIGSVLWDVIDVSHGHLGGIKSFFREKSLQDTEADSKVYFYSDENFCKVTVPETVFTVPSSLTSEEVCFLVGEKNFKNYFEIRKHQTVRLKESVSLDSLSPDVRKSLSKVLEMQKPSPRVKFNRRRI